MKSAALRPLRVLIAEDSEADALQLVQQLRLGGWKPQFLRVDSYAAMEQALHDQEWDLIISDHDIPQFDSNDALVLIKKFNRDIPVLIVSGSNGEEIAVTAMKSGAHDYIMKNNMARLNPAVERELREAEIRHKHRLAENAIRHMAYHDSLTNLVNRNEFEQRLQHAFTHVDENSHPHALLYLDLDQFKIINDTCGHIAGDELLRQLATLLHEHVRDNDTVARLGGDEFGILLEHCPLRRARRIAEKIRQSIKNFRFAWQDKTFAIGVSIGLTSVIDEIHNVNEVLSNADMACYTAKELGRNRIHIYSEDDEELSQRRNEMQWVARINQALEDNSFVLHQQTIQSLANTVSIAVANGGRTNAPKPVHSEQNNCEFLLRMHDENGLLIPPGAFIPAAERYDLMPALDRWVIEAVFSYLDKLTNTEDGPSPSGVYFINISGASFSDSTLSTYIKHQLQMHQIPPEMICFEVTETSAIANLARAVEFIREIKELGCKFALDDFGSGMSSFSYLKTIPIDYLKIDGGFVKNMLTDPMDCAIVQVINQIGHVAGLKTIAEFVEDNPTRDRLISLGIDYVQGYGIERPKPLT